jgi:hypothetical protein
MAVKTFQPEKRHYTLRVGLWALIEAGKRSSGPEQNPG